MAVSSRYRAPKSLENEQKLTDDSVPKNTQNSTKWALKVFQDWQKARANKDSSNEVCGFGEIYLTKVGPLSNSIEEMSAESLNFWLTKFVCEVTNQKGGRYPPKTLNLLTCALNRHLEMKYNIHDKNDRR